MNARWCVVALLLAACNSSDGNDSEGNSATASDASSAGARDAGRDARTADAARDARTVTDARSDEADAADDASEPAAKDAAVDSSTPPKSDAGAPPSGSKGVFIAVGYRSTRLVSRDLGLTWTETGTLTGGGDDENLLRSVAFANGVFVAAGHKIWTSTDAATWTERQNPESQWLGGMAYGNGLFVGAGGFGYGIFSSDGVSWQQAMDRNSEPARSVAFGGGKFMCATDPHNWWSTTDGNNWTFDSGGHASDQIVYCKDHFSDRASCNDPIAHGQSTAFGMGVYVTIEGNTLKRSTDNGKTWTDTKTVSGDVAIAGIGFGTLP